MDKEYISITTVQLEKEKTQALFESIKTKLDGLTLDKKLKKELFDSMVALAFNFFHADEDIKETQLYYPFEEEMIIQDDTGEIFRIVKIDYEASTIKLRSGGEHYHYSFREFNKLFWERKFADDIPDCNYKIDGEGY